MRLKFLSPNKHACRSLAGNATRTEVGQDVSEPSASSRTEQRECSWAYASQEKNDRKEVGYRLKRYSGIGVKFLCTIYLCRGHGGGGIRDCSCAAREVAGCGHYIVKEAE